MAQVTPSQKTIIIVTCTYDHSRRKEYFQRIIRVLEKVENIFWIVVEDDMYINKEIQEILASSGIDNIYLNIGPTRKKGNKQKKLALNYIKEHKLDGIVYIFDDDALCDPQLFKEIRKTKKVSIFPVGNLGPYGIERPIVQNGVIVGWDVGWLERKFPVDMGGFAFNAAMLQEIKGEPWDYDGLAGETEFLEKFVASQDELEPLCDNCTKCYAWHDQPLGKSIIYTKFEIKCINPLEKIVKRYFPLAAKAFLILKRVRRYIDKLLYKVYIFIR